MMDDAPPPPYSDERNTRFKLIPRVTGGPWMVRKAVGSTPVLLGTKITHRCVAASFVGRDQGGACLSCLFPISSPPVRPPRLYNLHLPGRDYSRCAGAGFFFPFLGSRCMVARVKDSAPAERRRSKHFLLMRYHARLTSCPLLGGQVICFVLSAILPRLMLQCAPAC